MSHCRKHPEHKTETHCKLCREPYCTACKSHHFYLCEGCMYKVLIMIFIAMIVVSYAAWFGIF
jgi:hypothetical protein